MRLTALLLLLALPALAGPKPKVRFKTSMGTFVVQLEPEAAPKTVENFLGYVRKGFYKDTVFHRVMRGFMIQGGGLTADLKEKPAGPSIPNESKAAMAKGLKNRRGTLAMARTWIPDSAKAQFFINVQDNAALDIPYEPAGYCVFGKVVQGMDVVDKIQAVKTGTAAGMRDVPKKAVVILDAAEVR